MNKIIFCLFIFIFLNNNSFASFKIIKKKATITKPEIIFPVASNDVKSCERKLLENPEYNKVKPLLKVKAPAGYGLDDRYDLALDRFTNFSFPCGGGDVDACIQVKKVILEWAKANAAKRTGPSDDEGRHWNDTLTVNLYIASPMMAAYSFAIQVIDIPKKEDKIIKDWFKKIVKRNQHLMYSKTYNYGGAAGTPKRAHNHALSSAISHMQLGVLLNDNKLFRKAFINYEAALKYQRKDGSLPIETRRGGRAMFYQARAMNALAVIAIIAENQGHNIWDLDFKGKNYHNLVKFFIDFTESNEVVFKYAKEMRSPGPAKNYKVQDLKSGSSSNWGWLYAYITRFPDHKNTMRIKKWSTNLEDLNFYQRKLVDHYLKVGKEAFSNASWTVVRPDCHFIK
ncbi:alginate lyase family protein [Candidatus Pelagibacter sp.]|nr:alginate lyase family protein [Candidatus Pelagibacter sp.]